MFCAKRVLYEKVWKHTGTNIQSITRFLSVYVHAYLCVYDYMYKLRRNILTKD